MKLLPLSSLFHQAAPVGLRTLFSKWPVLRRLLLLASIVSGPICSAQATIHVPSDEPSIQAGINAAQTGDTVLVAPGTYNENIDFKGKGITLTSGATSYADAQATIINGVADGAVVSITTGEPKGAVLNGFTIQGGYSSVFTQGFAAGVAISNSSPTVSNNIIQNNIGCGVAIVSAAYATLTGNDIRNNRNPLFSERTLKNGCAPNSGAAGSGTGVALMYASSAILINNIIENNTEIDSVFEVAGLYVFVTPYTFLMNNIFRGNNPGGGVVSVASQIGTLIMVQNLFGPGQVSTTGGSASMPYLNLIEINNTMQGGDGLVEHYGASTLENNIFDSTQHFANGYASDGLDCGDPWASDSPIVIHTNDIFSPYATSSDCNIDASNLAVDPEFLDRSGGNFHTQRTSPVVAAGDINAPLIPPTDLDGKNRTVCGTIDMGVYEVHPSPATVVTSSNNPSVGGTFVTFTAKVPGNCNTPTGTATFVDGATPLGTVSLDAAAQARFTTAQLTVGSHNITVTYPGDFNFDPSTSAVLVQVVTGYPTATTLLQVSPNPAQALQAISLSASVSSPFGNPLGTISFYAGSILLATAAINSNGVASTTVNTLTPGTYNITAVYNATTNYASSTSAPVVEVVIGVDSVTSLTALPNPAYLGQKVTFSVTVRSAQGATVPSGTVTLTDGSTPLGSAALDASGSASFGISTLSLGWHTITATYSSTGNFNPSSASVVENILVVPSGFTIALSPATLTFSPGTSATDTIQLTSFGNFAGPLTLTYGTLPEYATATINPATVTLTAGGSASSTLTLNTLVKTANSTPALPRARKPALIFDAILLALVPLGLARTKRIARILSVVVLAIALQTLTGCTNVFYYVSTVAPGTYQVPITATDINHNTQISTLTVVVTP